MPFRAAIEAGAPAVLLSHGLYAADDFVVPGSLSRRITTDLLRDELKFKGVAITDDLADPPITALGTVPDAAVKAVRAGADMLYVSGPAGDQQAAYVAVLRAVRSGRDLARAAGPGGGAGAVGQARLRADPLAAARIGPRHQTPRRAAAPAARRAAARRPAPGGGARGRRAARARGGETGGGGRARATGGRPTAEARPAHAPQRRARRPRPA